MRRDFLIYHIIVVFVLVGCQQYSKTGIRGDNNNNNQVVITDKGNIIINDRDKAVAETSPSPPTPTIPKYSGKIGHLKAGKEFIDFIYKNDAQVVYIDTYFDVFPDSRDTIHTGDDDFTLWSECNNLPINQPPSSMYCTGVSFNLNALAESESTYGYNQGFQHLKGYWSVRTNPGMHQGLLSVTLTAVDTKDAR
jgi:hypothetical protein